MLKIFDEIINKLYANDPELTKLDLHVYIEITQISNEKWEELCNALVWNTRVHTLVLTRSEILQDRREITFSDILNGDEIYERWVRLCKALKLNTGIKKLEMSRCNGGLVDRRGLVHFVDVIISNRTLQSISFIWEDWRMMRHYLGFNNHYFLDALRMNPKLEELDISMNSTSYQLFDAQLIIDIVKYTNLKILKFTMPEYVYRSYYFENSEYHIKFFNAESFKEEFIKALKLNRCLEQVKLARAPFCFPPRKEKYESLPKQETEINQLLNKRDFQQQLIAAAQGLQKTKLPPNKQFQFLPGPLILHILSFLDHNNTRAQAIRQLEDHNNALSKVTGLRMSKSEQFEYLTLRLSAQDETLKNLNLSSKELWRLSEKRWFDFCNALAHNRHLETLDLSLNALYQIDPEIWDLLAKALETNCTLKSINFSHNFLQCLNQPRWFKFYRAATKVPEKGVISNFSIKEENYKRSIKLGKDVILSPISIPMNFVIGGYDLAKKGVRRIKRK